MKKIYKTLAVLVFLLVGACNLDGDLNNPNQVSVSGADVNLLMNAIQLDFGDFVYNAGATVDPLMRMNAMTGGYRYQTANQPQSNDGLWFQAYQTILINCETMLPLAKAKGLTTHIAVAELIEAYVWMTLVDIFGDVPYTEALQGVTGNYNPKQDGGKDIYQHALDLIVDARTQLAFTGSAAGGALPRDVYYNGDRVKWNAFANTLELKLQMNLAQVPANAAAANARIAVLLNGSATSDIIDTEAENFTYKYGTATVPDSRHPLYNAYYSPTKGAAGGYIANYYLYNTFAIWDPTNTPNLSTQDPRWRWYWYRQAGSVATMYLVDPKAIGCTPAAPPPHYLANKEIFCVFDPGFYGRDHGDASGTPPSGPVVTCYGIYPAGGRYDGTSITNGTYTGQTQRGDGANGAGVVPIWMHWFTDFIRAEYLYKQGQTLNAQNAMQLGITNSTTEIGNWAKKAGAGASGGGSLAAYKTAVDGLFNNPATTNKQEVIGMEFYKTLIGNGLEAYNLYRRTSTPKKMQATLQINPGPWLRTQVYPSAYVNLNQNAKQKDAAQVYKTFWDNNPDVLN